MQEELLQERHQGFCIVLVPACTKSLYNIHIHSRGVVVRWWSPSNVNQIHGVASLPFPTWLLHCHFQPGCFTAISPRPPKTQPKLNSDSNHQRTAGSTLRRHHRQIFIGQRLRLHPMYWAETEIPWPGTSVEKRREQGEHTQTHTRTWHTNIIQIWICSTS